MAKLIISNNNPTHIHCEEELETLKLPGVKAPVELDMSQQEIDLSKWYPGATNMTRVTVRAIAKLKPALPIDKYHLLEAQSTDDDKPLYWFLNDPIACDAHDGYFYIPGYEGYVINKLGVVLNVKTKRQMTWYKANTNGSSATGDYKRISLKSSLGTFKTVLRHYLLQVTFSPPIIHPSRLMVIHINKVKTDDNLYNLAWERRPSKAMVDGKDPVLDKPFLLYHKRMRKVTEGLRGHPKIMVVTHVYNVGIDQYTTQLHAQGMRGIITLDKGLDVIAARGLLTLKIQIYVGDHLYSDEQIVLNTLNLPGPQKQSGLISDLLLIQLEDLRDIPEHKWFVRTFIELVTVGLFSIKPK